MRTKLPRHLSLEQFSQALQVAIAQLQDAGIEYVEASNLYYKPVDEEGKEVTIWDNKLKKGKKVPREDFIVRLKNQEPVNQ